MKGNARSSPAILFAQVALAENRLLTVAGVTVIKAWRRGKINNFRFAALE